MKTLKMMMIMAVTLVLCVSLLSGCQQSGIGSGGNDPTTTTQAATTITEAPTTTEATTTTTEPAVVYTVNEDRLAEIGRTFAELEEQYGEVTSSLYDSGGKIYYLQNSNCAYFFGEAVGQTFDETKVCKEIIHLQAAQLFNGLTETVSNTEFAEMYGLEHLWTEQKEFYNDNYMSKFLYGEYELLIYANENYQIGPDSLIEYIRPKEE